ncbi:MAG: hypothetical protein CVU11_12245 [Bacteroidetes bacterium HGW-Bacteroidetes-6]|nr:MAG: hypothetical protein CVU11_12245 [Bacteroidetes bacterium HGW-Bacteroidetes-6]
MLFDGVHSAVTYFDKLSMTAGLSLTFAFLFLIFMLQNAFAKKCSHIELVEMRLYFFNHLFIYIL